MNDLDVSIENKRSRVGRFAGGALVVVAAIALFLYADGYFDPANGVEAELPPVFIEGG